MGWRTEVKVAFAVATVTALWVLLWLIAPYIPPTYAEMCPYPRCMDDMSGTDAARPN